MIGVGDNVVCVDAGVFFCGKARHLGRNAREGTVSRVRRLGLNSFCGCPNAELGDGSVLLLRRLRKVSPKSASKHIEDMKKLPERAREMEVL